MKKNLSGIIALSLAGTLAWADAGSMAHAEETPSRAVILREGARLLIADGSQSGEPLALAAADFDEDGVPDLIASYGSAQGGTIVVRRGNVDAIYPNSPEAKVRKQNGQFTEAAFLAEARSFAWPDAADLLGAGDFDADGHWDIVGARTGGDKLFWRRGDGRGNFSAPELIKLDGTVTALVTGEMNRADGLTDVAVGVVTTAGARVLVFESPNGALRAEPESLELPAAASALALGQFDDLSMADLAAASGSEVVIVHGRDRKLSQDAAHRAEVKPAQLQRLPMEAPVISLASGDFAGDVQAELAALAADGSLHILDPRRGSTVLRMAEGSSGKRSSSARLLAAKVSSLPKDDLVVFGGSNDVRIVTTREADSFDGSGKVTKAGNARMRVAASLPSQSEVTAILPMRLNRDALKDLVLLNKNSDAPIVIATQPAASYVVNALGNSSDVTPGNGVCLDNAGNCTFPAAIQEANAHAGADTIEFNIPGAGPPTVSPSGRFFTDATTVDGTTQPGGRVEVASGDFGEFLFYGGNSVVRGVATYFAPGGAASAIYLASSGNVVEGNYIGFKADETLPSNRTNAGISFRAEFGTGHNNLIGGTTAQARNVISSCNTAVYLSNGSSGNTIRGNYIGTNVAGTAAVPNTNEPIRDTQANGLTIGGTAAGAGNVISGNTDNSGRGTISIENATATLVQGNFIGTTADGMQPLSNSGVGISLSVAASGTVTIGGTTTAARNVISANSTGIILYPHGAGGSELLQGNFIGTNAAGTGALPNLGPGVRMTGNNATLGGTASGAGNLISGNGSDGVLISPEFLNTVQGNFIGTDVTGTVAIPNFSDGVEIQSNGFNGARNNLIGGTSPEARNVISGNRENGIRYASSGDAGPNRAEGNYIGVNRFGTGALGNGQHGVFFQGAPNNVGGSAPGASNLIAFNGGDGIASSGGPFNGVLLSNSIFSNAGLGIDISNNGVTPFQGFTYGQYPVINSVSSTDSETTVTGKLRTRTDGGNLPQTIQFFSSASSDPSGHGEGQTFVGQTTISAGSGVDVPFTAVLTPPVPPGRYISAVAVGQGDTNNPNAIYSSEFSFGVRTAGEATPENTPLHLNLITQNTGGNTGSTTTTIIGEGISQGATVLLRRSGQADIIGVIRSVSSDGSAVEVTFDLTTAALGLWDLVVTNPDGSTFTLPAVFTVEAGRGAQVWMHLLGRDVIRVNRAARYTIVYGNQGNSDAYAVPLWVAGIPKDAVVTLGFDFSSVPTPTVPGAFDPNQFSPIMETDAEKLLPLLAAIVPAGGVRTLEFTIEVPNGTGNFTLRTWHSPSMLDELAGMVADRVSGGGFGPGKCTKSLITNLLGCGLSMVPGLDCLRSVASYILTSATADLGTISLLQLGAGAGQILYNCVTKEVPGISFIFDAVNCSYGLLTVIDDCRDGEQNLPVRPVLSFDPNDKIGNAGAGAEHFIRSSARLPYSIYFENLATASAPAQEVIITDQLDVTKLNLDTFELGSISFGNDGVLAPPPGLSEWTSDIDLRPQQNLIVRVAAALDRSSGVITWHFFSLDPATMQPTEDPLAGFLPPNVNPPEGDGAVTFSIDPYPSQPFGTQITNRGRIIFDTNPPIDTPIWVNTIDDSSPSSTVSPLAGSQSSRLFPVSWGGADTGAGVAVYTIYVSENSAPYTIWLANTPETTAIYDGRPDSSYAFYSIAEDAAGNLEAPPASADATTTTPSGLPVQLVSLASTQHHGGAGFLDLNMPLSGQPGIECRDGGAEGHYILVFSFTNLLTRVDDVSVSTGPDTFDGGAIGPDAHEYFVHLTGIATGQYVTVTLNGAGDAAGNWSDSVQPGVLGVLVGDTTADGSVNASDIGQAKAESGASLTSGNFRIDVTTNGMINASDISLIKSQSGAQLMAPAFNAPQPSLPRWNNGNQGRGRPRFLPNEN